MLSRKLLESTHEVPNMPAVLQISTVQEVSARLQHNEGSTDCEVVAKDQEIHMGLATSRMDEMNQPNLNLFTSQGSVSPG